LEVGDCCRFHQNALDRNLFEVAITRPIKLWSGSTRLEEEEDECCYCCAAAQYESSSFSYTCDLSIGSEKLVCTISWSWVELS
jgi:hypothetical protein